MTARPLPLILALLILVVAGGVFWYFLSRPEPQRHGDGAGGAPTHSQGDVRQEFTDTGPYHEITAAYPLQTPLNASAGALADAAASAAMKGFVEQEVARFKEHNVNALTQEDVDFLGIGGERKYVLNVSYVVYESPQTVSYVYSMFADTLGAHPNGYYRTFTFDKQSGEELHLDDLFASADYLDVLSMLAREKLDATLGAEGEYNREYMEAGTTPFPDNFQNFYLHEDEFVIVFPPYQVGPWVIGTQEARMSRTELGNTLSAPYR